MSNFEKAAKLKLRFQSTRGPLNVEDLFDLPLTSKSGFDLDSVAKAVNRDLKDSSEESFVAASKPASVIDSLRLDIVKSVIATKIAERDERAAKADKKQKRDRLLELLANKEDAALQELTPDQIKEQLAALDD